MSARSPFAFGSLDDRAGIEGTGNPADRISLRDHVVEVEIGAFQFERGHKQHVSFDVVVEVQPPATPLADDVDRILSYEMLVEAIATELAVERLNLLETLAERIADRILHAPQAMRVFLRIQKLDLGPGALGVEIVRSKDPLGLQELAEIEEPVPHPVVVYLSNAAIASDRLSSWLDQLQNSGEPVIICVGQHEMAVPETKISQVQNRIDLLAMEQNAWSLAAKDDRCLVIDSRAEFEWAARNLRMSVWAPSKIVLDATDSPDWHSSEPVSLVEWFAASLEAKRLILIDAQPTEQSSLRAELVGIDQNII